MVTSRLPLGSRRTPCTGLSDWWMQVMSPALIDADAAIRGAWCHRPASVSPRTLNSIMPGSRRVGSQRAIRIGGRLSPATLDMVLCSDHLVEVSE